MLRVEQKMAAKLKVELIQICTTQGRAKSELAGPRVELIRICTTQGQANSVFLTLMVISLTQGRAYSTFMSLMVRHIFVTYGVFSVGARVATRVQGFPTEQTALG